MIDCSVFVKTTKTAYQLKSNEVTVASIKIWQMNLLFC